MCTTLKRYQGESDLLNVTYNLSQLYQQNSAEICLAYKLI